MLSLKSFNKQVNAAPLAVYRISFGILMLFSTLRFISNGWVSTQYLEPSFHFSYYGFEWLPYPSSVGIWVLFTLMIVGSISILLGFLYRIGTILFFLSFTYIELLDKANYLNHYYFVSLIAFLLILIPANKYISLDARLGIVKASNKSPLWCIRILQFQIAVVYFFAGLAKIEWDWLFKAQPLKYWLHTANHWPLFGQVLKQDWVAYVFSWIGMVYDLSIVAFLLIPKTRVFAYLCVIFFHLLTWMLFPIGVFPWVMIVGTLIFFSNAFHEKIISILKSVLRMHPLKIEESNTPPPKLIKPILTLFICIQLLFPFRYLLYDGNILWTEHGYRFSWRVMLMEKTGYATFYILDPKNNNQIEINNSQYLTKNQEKMMSTQPDMILQFAHFLGNEFADTTINKFNHQFEIKSPEVRAEVYVTLNSRPNQLFVSPDKDLMKIKHNLNPRIWLEAFNP